MKKKIDYEDEDDDDDDEQKVPNRSPPHRKLRSRDTRNFTTTHAFPAGNILFMVCRHRGHNRGVGPFLPSFLEDKIV